MTAMIEDACFSPGAKIRVDAGATELVFRHCLFEGCDIFVAEEVQQMIFMRCLFRGTVFSGQPLTPRIASGCQHVPVQSEMAAAPTAATPHARFRR